MQQRRRSEPQDRLAALTRDFLFGVQNCWKFAQRSREAASNSLTLRQLDDVVQCALAIFRLAGEGLHTPVQREIRHLLRLLVQTVYVDQQWRSQPMGQRLHRLQGEVAHSGLDKLVALRLDAFRDDVRRAFQADVRRLYDDCRRADPLSREELGRRLARLEEGAYPGFCSELGAAGLNQQLFRLYETALVLLLHALGLRLAGEVFVKVLDEEPGWVFHRSRYLDEFSAYFDFKPQRRAAD